MCMIIAIYIRASTIFAKNKEKGGNEVNDKTKEKGRDMAKVKRKRKRMKMRMIMI